MKNLILFFGILTLCNGCLRKSFASQAIEVSEEELPQNCAGITNLLSSQWLRHKSENYHLDNKDLFELLNSKFSDCIKSLNRNQVTALFGQSNEEYADRTVYYLNASCHGKLTKPCFHLVFYFYPNNEGVVFFIREQVIVFN